MNENINIKIGFNNQSPINAKYGRRNGCQGCKHEPTTEEERSGITCKRTGYECIDEHLFSSKFGKNKQYKPKGRGDIA